jgi:hypothetical protein
MTRIDEFEVVIQRDGGTYIAAVPQLGLFARGPDPATALGALEAKKKRLAADIDATGGVVAFPQLPPPSAKERSRVGALGLFAAKVAIFLLLVCGALIGSGAIIANKLHGAIVSAMGSESVGGSRFWSKIEQELHRAADPRQELPEEKKQQLLEDLRVVVKRWRPFVAEIEPLLSGSEAGAAAPPAK